MDRRHQRRGEVKRRHRRPRIGVEGVVQRRPGAAPDLLARVDHDPADLRRAALGRLARQPFDRRLDVALLGRPPRWRGRDGEVDRAAEVVRGGELARGAREPLRVTGLDEQERQVRLHEPGPVDDREQVIERCHLPRPADRALQPHRGQGAEAERAIGDDRVADPQAAAKGLGIVVGELVGHHEAPHLQREEDDVAGAGARAQDRHCHRAGRQRGNGDRGRDPPAPADQRHRDRGGERGAGREADRRALRGRGAARWAEWTQGGRV